MRFGIGLANVPNFDTAFTTSIYKFSRIADGHSTDNFAVVQGVDASSMSWDAWTMKGIIRKWHRLYLAVTIDMK